MARNVRASGDGSHDGRDDGHGNGRDDIPIGPLFVLAPPRSFTSVVCAMLGQHPQMYGLPEVNLLVSETMRERSVVLAHPAWGQHGLLRAVAELWGGEQTRQTIMLAERWVVSRLDATCISVFDELLDRIEPRVAVEKSPRSVLQTDYLWRAWQAYPEARFLHLTRHPQAQGKSLWKMGGARTARSMRALDLSTQPPTPDPQRLWFRSNVNIVMFLAGIPSSHQRRVAGEDLLAEPEKHLAQIARWLDLSDDDDAIDAMLHPEDSPFAVPGPPNALFGNDPSFLQDPELREWSGNHDSLDGPVDWRRDGAELTDEVKDLARSFGYE